MNYCEIKNADMANGLGMRVSLFVSGCTHHCKGCFNQEAWDFNYGKPFTEETIKYILELIDKPYIHGLTILGGEPMHPSNQIDVLKLIVEFRNKFEFEKDIWVYTGYTFEELMTRVDNGDNTADNIVAQIDVLVDGRFELEKKDISLQYRGSSNQRIIDMVETCNQGKIVLLKL